MAKTKSPPGLPKVSFEEFIARHRREHREIVELMGSRRTARRNTLANAMEGTSSVAEQTEVIRQLLAAASRENCPDAYSTYLNIWLCWMGLPPPEGVLRELPGKPGRARKPETAKIYAKWTEIGEPPLGRGHLAHAFYGGAFTRASSAERKAMVDRCRRAVERRQEQLRRKPK